MVKPGKKGLARVLDAFGYSMQGLLACWKNEAAFRQEVILTIVLIPLALYFADTGIARALLVGSCLLVLLMEIVNSAIEAVVDRISDEHHELSGIAKDLGSAAVFISLLNLVVVWVLVLI